MTLNLNLAVSQLVKLFETAELKLFSETIETETEVDARCCSNFLFLLRLHRLRLKYSNVFVME
jgi:hypothetical protein